MTRIVIADDQVLIRAGLAAIVRAAPGLEVCGEAADGEEAVALAATTSPDVVLMDIRMPNVGGIEATERIVATGPSAPKVLILTTFDEDENVYLALRAGASGFVLKDTAPERLLAGISDIASGDMLFAPSVSRRLVAHYTAAPRSVPESTPGFPDGPGPERASHALDTHTRLPLLAELTAREAEVLGLVGEGLGNQDIADRLVVSPATVKTHLNRVLAKLRLASRAQAVVMAYEAGLVRPGRSRPQRLAES